MSQVDPVVVEISKVVTGWLPDSINRMTVSPQNSFVTLTGKDDKNLYIYRFYNDGQKTRCKRGLNGRCLVTVQALTIANDMIFTVTLQGDRYCTTWLSLNSLDKSGPQFSDDEYKPGGPLS